RIPPSRRPPQHKEVSMIDYDVVTGPSPAEKPPALAPKPPPRPPAAELAARLPGETAPAPGASTSRTTEDAG
ncbi:MAG TPA: hypothetical protein VGZ72_20565, partial [Stellaceae bacterium]|nr:hypothetical protein [Stellaceae bacterium]